MVWDCRARGRARSYWEQLHVMEGGATEGPRSKMTGMDLPFRRPVCCNDGRVQRRPGSKLQGRRRHTPGEASLRPALLLDGRLPHLTEENKHVVTPEEADMAQGTEENFMNLERFEKIWHHGQEGEMKKQ